MPTGLWGHRGRRIGAGPSRWATTEGYFGIFFFCVLIHLLFSIIMSFIVVVFYYSIVWPPCGSGDGALFSHFYINYNTNSNL